MARRAVGVLPRNELHRCSCPGVTWKHLGSLLVALGSLPAYRLLIQLIQLIQPQLSLCIISWRSRSQRQKHPGSGFGLPRKGRKGGKAENWPKFVTKGSKHSEDHYRPLGVHVQHRRPANFWQTTVSIYDNWIEQDIVSACNNHYCQPLYVARSAVQIYLRSILSVLFNFI